MTEGAMNDGQGPGPAAKRAFIALCLLGGAAAAVTIGMARLGGTGARSGRPLAVMSDEIAAIRSNAHVAFRNLSAGPDYGTLSVAPLEGGSASRRSTSLPCDRVYTAGQRTVCLANRPNERMKAELELFGAQLESRHLLQVGGIASRTRLSRNGRHAAYTVFVGRDSYLAVGFSTRTGIVDTEAGASLGDLESYEASLDGTPFRASDFNYWGVTFAGDDDTFYATLGTGRHTYLVRGSIVSKRVTVLLDGVECPSLSPDGRRIAFKKKNGRTWRPAVLALDSLTETVLPELRSVDDQIEWLDDNRVLYALRHETTRPMRADVWMADVNALTPPTIFLPDAESPSIVRPRPAPALTQD